jgi:hypothetical protein
MSSKRLGKPKVGKTRGLIIITYALERYQK